MNAVRNFVLAVAVACGMAVTGVASAQTIEHGGKITPTGGAKPSPASSAKVDKLLFDALTLFEKGKEAAALAKVDEALELDPENVTALLFKGMLHCLELEFEKAKRVTDAVLKLDPKNSDGWMIAGTAQMGLGDTTKAKKYLKYAIEYNPKNAAAYELLIAIHEDAGDDAEAEKVFQQYLKATDGKTAKGKR